MAERFTNGAQTTLGVAIDNSTQTVVVADATGFPGSGQFRVRVGSELILVTAVSGTTWTASRGQESTTAASHAAGSDVVQVLTAGALQELTALTTNQLANAVFAGPAAGGAGAPAFRALVAADLPSGVVTSVDASGGATGLSFSGGPVTGSGTLTLGGTLAVGNGGTGQATANDALNALLPAQGSHSGKVLTTDGTNASWETAGGGGGGAVSVSTQDFRLTTESGVPISPSDRTAQSTIYLTPYVGNQIALFDGTSTWTARSSAEVSLALSSLTTGANYDVFAYWSGSAVVLELSAAWADDTTRSNALALQDGVLVKSGATTRRYVGTLRTSGTATTEDADRQRFVWNTNNRVLRKLKVRDNTTSWTYNNSSVWREARGQTTNQAEVVVGWVGTTVDLTLRVRVDGNSGNAGDVSIGADSTTTPSSELEPYFYIGANTYMTVTGRQVFVPGIGFHYFAWLERGGGGTTVFEGKQFSGIQGVVNA